jgi:hypothetical protein
MADVDFGTYHHTTPGESQQIRDSAEKAAIASTNNGANDKTDLVN